jgi:hypothetical protein
MEQKSLFATKNGYLCLAHSSAEIGDSIAVRLGADTTCVIRKQDAAHRFITACEIYGLDTARVLETTKCSEGARESENPEERAEPQCNTYADGASSLVRTTRTTQRMQLLYATLTQGYGWPQMMAQATTPAAALPLPRNDIPELVSEDVVPAFFDPAAEEFVWTIEAQRTAPWEKFC